MSAKICPQCGTRYTGDNRFCTLDGASLVAENPADSLAGSVLADRYLVREKLGEGGMGEVYLAEHVRMKRKVAVKVMRKWLTSDAASIGRFHREAENASQITHPNVAAVYDFGETSDGLVYLAMEYVPGEPLTHVLERESILNHMRAADLVSQVADALGAAHALGILHRDLKPDNVMVARTRNDTDLVKLLDFGIARVMGRDTQHFTSTGLIVGTPDWMSPEQISGDQLDARSDIYSLGLIAFRMITGEGAFSGGTSQETLLAKMTKSPRRLAEVRPELAWPDVLQAALDRALATDPASRYGDALAFASDFYFGVSQLPMTPEAEAYLARLSQRAVTPARGFGSIEPTPPRGIHTLETPIPGRSGMTGIGGGARVDSPAPRGTSGVTQPFQAQAVSTPTPPAPHAAAAGTSPHPDLEAASEAETAEIPSMETLESARTPPVVSPGLPDDRREEGTGPTVAVRPEKPARRIPLVPIAGAAAAVLTALVLLNGGDDAAPGGLIAMSAADSAQQGLLSPGADSAGMLAGDTVGAGDSASVAGTLGAVLDSVARRSHASVFGVVGRTSRGSGFLADSTGIVITAASLVGSADTAVRVFLDAARWVHGRVVRRDAATGLAALLIPARHCEQPCPALPLAQDSAAPTVGDSVVAVFSPVLTSTRREAKGGLTQATAQRLSAAVRTLGRGTGAPLLRADGQVLGVARSANASVATAVPASAAQRLVTAARTEIAQRSIRPIDLLPPTWPSTPVSAAVLNRARSRTAAEIEPYHVTQEPFDIFLMTPQVMAWRKAVADSLRRTASPMDLATTCGGGGVCDPIERWPLWDEYRNERRAVVVMQVSPRAAPAPRIGVAAVAEFQRGDFLALAMTSDGAPVAPIDDARIDAVPNPPAYARVNKPVFQAGIYVFRPADLLTPSGAPRRVELSIIDEAQRNRTVRVTIPASVLQAVARDLGGAVR
ncbi:MAG TPA: protein kinase [Gemmatimonadaceae bacterium]|nr:protein kinase [Gemmatimonadaceae bacterium]